MPTILQTPLVAETNDFPRNPTLSQSYTDLVSLDGGLPYHDTFKEKSDFVRSEYDRPITPSISSTAPSSPLYTHSMGSRDSYFSTPSYSTLDPNEDLAYEEDDISFPAFDNNIPQYTQEPQTCGLRQLNGHSEDSIVTASPTSEQSKKDDEESVKDDHWVRHEPTRHVDFLSHEWQEQDIWSSWKYVNARERKKKHDSKQALANGERLENASWRTWTKAKYRLPTISPESLNWMKDCDVTWLYGPLQIDKKSNWCQDHSPPPSRLSTCSSFLHTKPILKKKSASAALLETSLKEHNLLSRVGDIIRIQQSSPVPRRKGLSRGGSDFSLPSYRTTSVSNTPAESARHEATSRYSFGTDTPSECKHVLFDETVRQVQAIESEDDEKDEPLEQDIYESDEDDDGGLMMAPARSRSNRSTPRNSFSDNNKTITPLPSTTLKYRKDTPEPPDTLKSQAQFWVPGRGLQHSASQETLKPSNPSSNFLLDDDPELNDDPWPIDQQGKDYSPYAQEDQDEPYGMRRTPSGMFMPYDENEEEAAMNNTLFGQAVYAVNTFRDIAHVVWNVGWNRGR
ncbi:protein phosphatase regulator [Lithohypha guttulata]|uniref:protein phosphatase regulator n=1 Tax=Lithohypha guttulata TaxID=1690604 RepID=UPI002DDE1DE8|nr:protein phosphatase regulator [Lithohypha guttulata]